MELPIIVAESEGRIVGFAKIGPYSERDVYAAPWTPDPSLGETLPPELIWAALDCPTSVPVANDPDDADFRPGSMDGNEAYARLNSSPDISTD